MSNVISGFTKTGFSKAGFSCCGHHTYCDLGRNACYYETIDEEVKQYCHCYLRNHAKTKTLNKSVEPIENTTEKIELFTDENGQLSLF